MPFKRKAQRRKFAELLMKGEISPETFEEWNRETGKAELPERVKPAEKRRSSQKPNAKRNAKPRKAASESKGRSKRAPKRAGRRRST